MTRLGRDDWKKLIEELEGSELTHKEFAAQKSVALPTLQFWLYKFRRESRHESRPAILPVELIGSAAPSARPPSAPLSGPAVEAVLPSGVLVRFPMGTAASYVREVLGALG